MVKQIVNTYTEYGLLSAGLSKRMMRGPLIGKVSALKFVPKWLIFLIDLFVSTLSFLLSFLLYHDFNITGLLFHEGLMLLISANLFVSALVFLRKRTYAGIIRMSSLQDMTRVFYSICSITVLLLGINILCEHSSTGIILPLSVISKHFLLLFFLLTCYRLLVKWIFEIVTGDESARKNVAIYGAGESGLITKQVIEHARNSGLHIVAFLDDNANKIGKELEGVVIYDAKKDLPFLTNKHSVTEVIFGIQHLDAARKGAMVDRCLSLGLRVVNIPPSRNWINGEFTLNQLRTIRIEELLEREEIIIDNQQISSELKNKVVLITGAAGSIGSELVRQVAKFGPSRILLCDQAESALYSIELEVKESFAKIDFQPVIIDIKNRERLEQVFQLHRPQYVFHAAAYKHVPMMESHPAEAVLNNVGGTKTVADLAVKYDVEKFVMISTDKAVNPTNVMGASKRIAEIYAQALNDHLLQQTNGLPRTKFITTRFGNVLGSNGSVIPRFREQIAKGGPLTVTHPDITRYFMTIPEACQLVLEAGVMGQGGEIFVFDMGHSVKIVDLAKKMIQLSGYVVDEDIKIVFTGLRPGEKLYEELLNDSESTLPTHHEKIMIANVRKYGFDKILLELEELFDAAKRNQDHPTVRKMKLIVPEFKSKHSVYELLDAVTSPPVESN